MAKKYYWLKLKRDFFKRHDIRIIEEMNNGKDYILFYLKLLLESIDHDGKLRFSEAIPYNEQMLAVVTNTNIDIVKAAMDLFLKLNMIEILDDETIFMNEVERLIGSESESAQRMRKMRIEQKTSQCDGDVTEKCEKVTQSKSKRKSLDIDIESDAVVEDGNDNGEKDVDKTSFEYMGGTLGKGVVLLTQQQCDALLDELGFDAFNHYVEKLADFIINKNAKVGSHYATIRKWAKEDAKL